MGKTINISVIQEEVLDEVAKTTAYIGSKKVVQREGAYDRIFVTTEDKQMLERFYNEGCNAVTNLSRRFVTSVGEGDYTLTLSVSNRFDGTLTSSIQSSIGSFLVNYILGKWCEIVDGDSAKKYSDAAAALLQDIKEKVFFKTKPSRNTPSVENN